MSFSFLGLSWNICYAIFFKYVNFLFPFRYANVGKIYESGATGISSLGGHNVKRTECVNRFVAEYGHMPLVSTSAKAVDSRSSWFW